MSTQPEYILELELIRQLEDLGYKKVSIANEDGLITNLEKHNKTSFTGNEFKQILNQLSNGNIYGKTKTLRDKIAYTEEDGSTAYIELINQIHWYKNQYQVTYQI
jgi:type I restriction enzyme R subunit